ncbi:ANTAR domain-containing protein [Bailinhaonella thermotolerans]|uniref:ANTAR domain-containing protein n=1 Tax=Bailinhaonella thermotolerans TaxID=1070861 RepID=UPI0011C34FE9|nr:ANTAR domain-containing protein [Bailinhaonella thermotolerans]
MISDHAVKRGGPISVQDVCTAGAEAIAVDGVGLSLLAGRRLEPLHVVGRLGREVVEAELTTGDGPCVEAATGDGPVLSEDLASSAAERRWPLFCQLAAAAGIRAAFAFPLMTQAVRVGVLVLVRHRPGALAAAEYGHALILADIALLLVLNDQVQINEWADPLQEPFLGAEIHQAAGMVSVQLNATVEHAHLRLRAHAFLHGESLSQVARQVVERRLRFTPDPSPHA